MRLYADGRLEGETDLERQLVEANNRLVAYGVQMPDTVWTDRHFEKCMADWARTRDRIKKARADRG